MVLVTICTAHTKQKLCKLFQKYFRKTERWFQQKIIVQNQYKTYSSGTHFLHDLRQPRKSRQTPSRPGSTLPPAWGPCCSIHEQQQRSLIHSSTNKDKMINSEQKLKLRAVQTLLQGWCWCAQCLLLHPLCSCTAPRPHASSSVLHREADGEHVGIKTNPTGRHVSADSVLHLTSRWMKQQWRSPLAKLLGLALTAPLQMC